MPYTKSISRIEFQTSIKQFKKQAKFVTLKKNNIPHEIQQCVLRNAIFQASASLEEYTRSVFEDWVHLLHKHNKKLCDVPKDLVYWSAGKKQRAAFSDFIIHRDEGKFIKTMLSLTGLNDSFNESIEVKSVFNHSEHVRDRKYPSKKNIHALFVRFGITDIFHTIQVKGKKDYKKILKSFSDIRTEIAHQHPSPDLSFLDVRNNLDAIDEFIGRIDSVLYWHVIHHSGEECWKTSVWLSSTEPTAP